MTNFTIEAWTYLAIDIVWVFARFFAQWRVRGFKGLKPDDFLMVVALVWLTAIAATSLDFPNSEF
jgi:hypothetical protein